MLSLFSFLVLRDLMPFAFSLLMLCLLWLHYWVWTDPRASTRRVCSTFQFGVSCPQGGWLLLPARRAGDGPGVGLPAPRTAFSAPSAKRATSPSQVLSISSRLVGSAPANPPYSLDARRAPFTALQYCARIRGGGGPEEEGVPWHESAISRQLTLSPEPSVPDREATDSSNAVPHALPHTLQPHGYMGVEGESSGAAS